MIFVGNNCECLYVFGFIDKSYGYSYNFKFNKIYIIVIYDFIGLRYKCFINVCVIIFVVI